MTLLTAFDYAGVAVFAATGALAASRKQLDLVGFLFLAALTGIGGGTIRDLVLGATPVFWVKDPTYLLVCAATAVLVFVTAHLVESRYRLLLWLDAIGLAAYAVMGAAKGFDASGSATVGIVTGVMTATVGGILRDVVAEEASVLLQREVYVTAAIAGAGVYVGLAELGVSAGVASIAGVLIAFAARAGALWFGWTIPPYRSRPGRDPADL